MNSGLKGLRNRGVPGLWANTPPIVVLTTAVSAEIPMGKIQKDTAGMGVDVLRTGHVKIPVAGWYLIIAYGVYAVNATGVRVTGITHYRAGLSKGFIALNTGPGTASGAVGVIATSLLHLEADDEVVMSQYQNSGGNLNTDTSGAISVVWQGP